MCWGEDYLMPDPEFAWCWRRYCEVEGCADYFLVPHGLVVAKMARMAAQGKASA